MTDDRNDLTSAELAERAGRLRLPIMRLSRRIRRQTVGELTPSQFSALARIAELEPITLGRLADIEKVRPPSITRLTSVLEEQGLIERSTKGEDRRCVTVALTTKGWSLLNRIRARRDSFLARRLAELSVSDLDRLDAVVDILARLAEDARPAEELA